jgi:hypothetical protein
MGRQEYLLTQAATRGISAPHGAGIRVLVRQARVRDVFASCWFETLSSDIGLAVCLNPSLAI